MIELEMVETTYLDRARENSIRFGNGSPARRTEDGNLLHR